MRLDCGSELWYVENPHKHRDNIQPPHRKAPDRWWSGCSEPAPMKKNMMNVKHMDYVVDIYDFYP